MKHLIIGAGNLGTDIFLALKDKNQSARLGRLLHVSKNHYDYIWCCAGAGSVEAAKSDIAKTLDTHVTLPADMMQGMDPKTKLIFFSSTYCASEEKPENPQFQVDTPRSLYAYSKCFMERLILAHKQPNVACVRIGTLYGNHRPEKTFPGKMKALPKGQHIMPRNVVSPTPTWWLAEYLIRNLDHLFGGYPIHHVSPQGFVPTHTWAKMILGEQYTILDGDFDRERPPAAVIDCTLAERPPSWVDLWNDKRNQFR